MKVGDVLDAKYEILEQLGTGGMGEIYKVRHAFLGTIRVIKVIRPQFAATPEVHERFLREARLATRVQHPNVATLHDFSELPDGTHYTVWEYIEGENLGQRLREKKTLPPSTAVRVAIETLHGLEAIHRAGIVHRDISPENLMLTLDGDKVKIIDLGVAKSSEPDVQATQAGVFLGKFRYAPPEQLGFLPDGATIDARADLYSIGVVLYEMLVGRPPFDAKTPHDYILLHSGERQPHPIDMKAIPDGAELQQIISKALQRDRDKRYASARDFAADLERVEQQLATTMTVPMYVLPKATLPQAALPQETVPMQPLPTRASASGATLDTPMPVTLPDVPMPPEVARQQQAPSAGARRGLLVPLLVAVALIAVVGIGAVLFFITQRNAGSPSASAPVTTKAPGTSVAVTTQSAPATTSSVGSATAPAPVSTDTAVSSTSAPAATASAEPVRTETAEAEPPKRAPRIDETKKSTTLTYVDGGDGDRITNDAALNEARQALSGVTRVAVRGTASPLLDELRTQVATVSSIDDDAPVAINFSGTVDHLGFGRKKRSGSARITRKGRVLFRWELPPQVYRIGDDPAEAFSRVVKDLLAK